MRRKFVLLILALLAVASFMYLRGPAAPTGTVNTGQTVISLGNDLNAAQERQVLDYFGKFGDIRSARYIKVTNAEERQYLQGIVDEKLIGTRAISCAFCQILPSGRNINVTTHNITWVTPFMYANAMTTAGIKDAQVVVAAPFEVSGTAGLTGIIKAFETATGTKVSEQARRTANQEVGETSRLAQKIGKDKAETMVYQVKKEILAKKTRDPEEIRRIIIDVSARLNINLSREDIDRLTKLMQNISRLNINISRVNEQLQTWKQNLKKIDTRSRPTTGFLQQILDFLRQLVNRLAGLVS